MMLCSNRFPLPGSPSTCTLDKVLMPLPTWLLFVSLPLYFLFYRSRAQHKGTASTLTPTRFARILYILYIVLLVAAIIMSVLELARLTAADMGVGLLPFTPIGLALAIGIVVMRHRTGVPFPLSIYWLLLIIFESIKVSRLRRLQADFPAVGSMYPSSDQLIDNATDLGLYVFFLLVDIYEFWSMRMSLQRGL